MNATAARFALIAIALIFSVQCGKKTKSQEVLLEVNPDRPIVFTADAEIGGITAKAPWFSFTMKIGNLSTEHILIVAVKAKATISTVNGSTASSEVNFSPGLWNYTVQGSDPAVNCEFDTFDYYEPQGDNIPAVPLHVALEANSNAQCENLIVEMVYGGLPSSGSTNYRYTVDVSPVGYFVDKDFDPVDRFERSATFRTQ